MRVTLLQTFSLISLIGMLIVGFSLARLMGTALEDIATGRARNELTDTVRNRNPFWLDLPPVAFRALHVLDAEAAQEWREGGVRVATDFKWWDGQVRTSLAGLPIYQVKVWNPEGRVIWSDRPEDIGGLFPDDTNLRAALAGEVRAEFTNLDQPENSTSAEGVHLPVDTPFLEMYMPLLARDSFQVVAVLEIYEAVPDLYEDIHTEQQTVWTGLAIGLAGLYLLLVGLVVQASATIRRLDRLRELQRYFSPAVARAIAGGQGGPGAPLGGTGARALQARQLNSSELTIVFLDIRDFTRTTERLPPELVVQLLDDYLGLVTQVVFTYGGSVDKFLGDGVLAVFGAPLPDPDHPAHAVAAVQQIFHELVEMNKVRVQLGQPAIPVGASIVTGPAISGNIGSSQQLSFTVIGDTVNLGARLVGLAAPGEILLTSLTYDRARHSEEVNLLAPWHVGPLQVLMVRGRDAPTEVHGLRLDGSTLMPAADEPAWSAPVPAGARDI